MAASLIGIDENTKHILSAIDPDKIATITSDDNLFAAFLAGINAIRAQVVDINGVPVEFDTIAAAGAYGYHVQIDIEHHKIHEESHYTCQLCDHSVDIATPKYVLLRTPDTAVRIHLNSSVRVSKACDFEFFEAPTISADGGALATYNNYRPSSNVATMLMFQNPTVTADGSVVLLQQCLGSPSANPVQATGGNAVRARELVLKQNTDYVFKISPSADDTIVSLCIEWYEV